MIKNKVYIKKLRMPAYNTRLWIVVSNSFLRSVDVVEDLVDHKIISNENRRTNRAYMYAFEDPNGVYQVMIFAKTNAKPGEIAHETKHALNLIFKWHGVFLSTHNDETECHLLEWMIDQVDSSLKKCPTKRKKNDKGVMYSGQCSSK